MPQRAEPAQHGSDQPARQRAVAIFKYCQAGMAFELFIERAAAAQYALDYFRRNPARGEAGWSSEAVGFGAAHLGSSRMNARSIEI